VFEKGAKKIGSSSWIRAEKREPKASGSKPDIQAESQIERSEHLARRTGRFSQLADR
jgi:hypothetical protein